MLDVGLDAIEHRVRALSTQLIERADSLKLDVATPKAWSDRAGIVSLRVPDPERVQSRLKAKGILVSVKDARYLRLATHFYNTEAEIEQAVTAIAESVG